MLRYNNLEEFKKASLSCELPSIEEVYLCKLKPKRFLGLDQAVYILATNGFLVEAEPFSFINARFIGKTLPW